MTATTGQHITKLADNDDGAAAAERVDRHFRRHYGRGLNEYDITDTPGYWRRKEPCGGLGVCSSGAAHSSWGWQGGFRHTARYVDPTRDSTTGRIASPYRTWRVLRAASAAETEALR